MRKVNTSENVSLTDPGHYFYYSVIRSALMYLVVSFLVCFYNIIYSLSVITYYRIKCKTDCMSKLTDLIILVLLSFGQN